MAKKAKGNRVQVILECTEMKDSGMPGTSRYITTKNRKNTVFYHSTRFKNSAKFCISIRFTTFSILKYFPAGHFLICIKKSYQPVSGLRFQDSSPKKKPHESEEPSGRSEGVRTPDADNVRKQNAGCGHPLYVGK